jgi:hypothetical protein
MTQILNGQSSENGGKREAKGNGSEMQEKVKGEFETWKKEA